jgi:hypothetical protein
VPVRNLAVLPLAVSLIGLSACALLQYSVSGEDLAEAAENAAEDEFGWRPEMDCGDENITPAVGDEVDCLLTNPETGEEFDAIVIFTSAEGSQWKIRVEVPGMDDGTSDAPTEEPSDAASEEPSEQPTDQESLEISADRLATSVADVLESEMGSRNEIDCGTVNYKIWLDRKIYCTLIETGSGLRYQTTVTITEIDGDYFSYNVEVADTPR